MQETRNNCFGSKIISTTLLQAKTGKHECLNVTTMYIYNVQQIYYNIHCNVLLHFGTRAYLFSPEEGSWYVFSTRINCCEFLASDGVIFQNVTKTFFKVYFHFYPILLLMYSVHFLSFVGFFCLFVLCLLCNFLCK